MDTEEQDNSSGNDTDDAANGGGQNPSSTTGDDANTTDNSISDIIASLISDNDSANDEGTGSDNYFFTADEGAFTDVEAVAPFTPVSTATFITNAADDNGALGNNRSFLLAALSAAGIASEGDVRYAADSTAAAASSSDSKDSGLKEGASEKVTPGSADQNNNDGNASATTEINDEETAKAEAPAQEDQNKFPLGFIILAAAAGITAEEYIRRTVAASKATAKSDDTNN